MIVLGVEDLVEESMQLGDTVVAGEGESVSSLVTLGVLRVVAGLAVEWLHDVAHVVDQEAESVGHGSVLIIVKLFHKEGVHVAGLVVVATLARKPLGDVVAGDGNVASARLNIVVALLAFLNERDVLEVEV